MTVPAALVAALAGARASVAALEAVVAAMDAQPADELVGLRDGALGLSGDTLVRWARSGRLRAFEAERGRIVAWQSDIRAAIEAAPVRRNLRHVPTPPSNDVDELDQALAAGELRRGTK